VALRQPNDERHDALRQVARVAHEAVRHHERRVDSAHFSHDGQKIVSASWDNSVRVWSAATGECEQTLVGHSGWVNSAQFSPDGLKIVSASDDKSGVRLWVLSI
jgi:WD40 repeat protein